MQVYAGNLPANYSDEELRSLFEQYGKVRSATVGHDKKTRESQGYGFVEMPVKSEARAAIEALRGKKLGGKPLRVRALKPGDDLHQHALTLHGGSRPGAKVTRRPFHGDVTTRAGRTIQRSGKRGT
jgi:RNA recognition motif-containing protein